jgi:hypothetical protein
MVIGGDAHPGWFAECRLLGLATTVVAVQVPSIGALLNTPTSTVERDNPEIAMDACCRSIGAVPCVFHNQMNLTRADKYSILALISCFNPPRISMKIIKERGWQVAGFGPDYKLFTRQDDVRKMQVCIHPCKIASVKPTGECFHASNGFLNHGVVIIGVGSGLKQ